MSLTPLPIDERRVGKLADACDTIEAESPRGADWKLRRSGAYQALAEACYLAELNAKDQRHD